jgi:hypothetical protein
MDSQEGLSLVMVDRLFGRGPGDHDGRHAIHGHAVISGNALFFKMCSIPLE